MAICMTARYRVQPEMVEECKRTIIDFVKYIRINEPTTLFYMANQEMGHPTQFLHTMIFENEQAVAVHQTSPATQRFVDMIYPSAIEPLAFQEFYILGFKSDYQEEGRR